MDQTEVHTTHDISSKLDSSVTTTTRREASGIHFKTSYVFLGTLSTTILQSWRGDVQHAWRLTSSSDHFSHARGKGDGPTVLSARDDSTAVVENSYSALSMVSSSSSQGTSLATSMRSGS